MSGGKLVFCPLSSVLRHPFLAGLVVIARSLYPIPSRTRPSKSSAPMVLSLKAWKSRSLPGLPRTERFIPLHPLRTKAPRKTAGLLLCDRRYQSWDRRQHFLNFLPLPQGQGSLRPMSRNGLWTGSDAKSSAAQSSRSSSVISSASGSFHAG